MIQKWVTSWKTYFLILSCYLVGLTAFSVPLTGDQKTYISIAMEMRDRGAWIIPTLFERANFLKPPFQYWASILGWKLFGFSLMGSLFPSVLALLGSAYLVKRLSGEKSHLPALLFSGTLATMTYGTTSQMEIWIVLFYLLAWALWKDGKVFTSLVVVGLMSSIKGPLYPVLWVMSVALEKFLERKIKSLLNLRFGLSLLSGILLGLFWYGLAARTHLQEMMGVFFLKENVGKIHTQHGTPWGLWGEFLGTLFPLLIWFGFALFTSDARKRFRENKNFWLSYALIPALFFTFFPYRVNTYLYLLTPLAVWMMGVGEESLVRQRPRMGALSFGVASILGLLLTRLYLGGWIRGELLVFLVASLSFWVFAHFRASLVFLSISSLFIVNGIRLSAVEIGEWDLRGLRSVVASDPAPLAYFMEHEDIWHEYGLVSAALGKRVLVVESRDAAIKHLSEGGALILADEQIDLTQKARCQNWVRLKKRIKFPLEKLLLHGLRIDDPDLNRVFKVCKI